MQIWFDLHRSCFHVACLTTANYSKDFNVAEKQLGKKKQNLIFAFN